MLTWLADHANVFYFLFGAAALGLLAAGWLTRRPKYWGYTVGALGLFFAVWLLTKFIVTDRKQIVVNIDAMANAAALQKPDDIMRHIAKNFRHGSLTRDDIGKRVTAAAHLYKINKPHLWGQQVTIKGETAEAIFNFRADATDGAGYPASVRAKFVREENQWRLIDFDLFKLGTTDPLYVPGLN